MPLRQREDLPGNLSFRIAEVATEIITLETGLDRELCRHLVEKNTRLALAAHGLTHLAADTENLSTEARYGIAKAAFILIAEELRRRNVSEPSIRQLGTDLRAFYRGVRNMDVTGSGKAKDSTLTQAMRGRPPDSTTNS
jgi:hypothetical protein